MARIKKIVIDTRSNRRRALVYVYAAKGQAALVDVIDLPSQGPPGGVVSSPVLLQLLPKADSN